MESPSSVVITFSLKCPFGLETVGCVPFVVGNIKELGEWRCPGALMMERTDSADNTFTDTFTATLTLLKSDALPHALEFRYFIGQYLQGVPDAPRSLVVIFWEGGRKPRKITVSKSVQHIERRDEFGVRTDQSSPTIDDGWLQQGQALARVWICGPKAIKLYPEKYSKLVPCVKVVAFDIRCQRLQESIELEEGEAEAVISSSVRLPTYPSSSTPVIFDLHDKDCRFKQQEEYGSPYTGAGDFTFKAITASAENLMLSIEVYLERPKRLQHSVSPGEAVVQGNKVASTTGSTSRADCGKKAPVEMEMRKIGVANVLPALFGTGTCAIVSRTVSLNSPYHYQAIVGELVVQFTMIRALPESALRCLPMDTSFARYWRRRNVTLDVGHRGVGTTYQCRQQQLRFYLNEENTIAALKEATKFGSDYVEFDVQLSKDRIPILYHDFYVGIAAQRRKRSVDRNKGSTSKGAAAPSVHSSRAKRHSNRRSVDDSAVHVRHGRYCLPHRTHRRSGSGSDPEKDGKSPVHLTAVKDLTLKQLRMLKLHHESDMDGEGSVKHDRPIGSTEDSVEHDAFATLKDALLRVDAMTGFNIELKYPLVNKQGVSECPNYFEPNEFVDCILSCVFEHAKNRRIIFSSFDAQICLMVKLKQNRYPVMFLTQGLTDRYAKMFDDRTNCSDLAFKFAIANRFLGVVFHCEDIIRDSTPLDELEKRKGVAFVWGNDLNDEAVLKRFREDIRVSGVIFDRITQRKERSENKYVLERHRKLAAPPRLDSRNSSSMSSLATDTENSSGESEKS